MSRPLDTKQMNRLYPIFVKLEGRACVVVGGGRIAAGKVAALLDAGAAVTVVSPALEPGLRALHGEGRIRWQPRRFELDDLDGASLVVAATDNPAVSSRVFAAAETRGILCNAVDQDEWCSFHVPAVASRGDIKVAISTSGRSPAFAAALKRSLQDALTDDDAAFVEELGRLRSRVLARWADDAERRKAIFQGLVDSYSGPPATTSGLAGATRTGESALPDRGELERQGVVGARPGTVYLVGAGPGDAGLLSVRGARLLRTADLVFFDRLVGDGVLDWIPARAERIYVGKETGRRNPIDTGRVIADAALGGKAVVRLKGGDPTVFGRGGDEMLACLRAGVPVEVVPGVSALTAVPAAAGIPITFRGIAHQVVVRSGYRPTEEATSALRPPAVAETTFVYFMTVGRLTEIVAELRERDGLSEDTPVAIVQRGTLPDQRVLRGTIGTIVDQASRAALAPPALVVAGRVAALARGAEALDELLAGATRVESVTPGAEPLLGEAASHDEGSAE